MHSSNTRVRIPQSEMHSISVRIHQRIDAIGLCMSHSSYTCQTYSIRSCSCYVLSSSRWSHF